MRLYDHGVKVIRKFYPITGHEGPEGEQRYSYTLSLTSALDWVGGKRHARPLYPLKLPSTHCREAWVGPRTGLKGGRISHPHWNSIPEPTSP